MLDLILNNLSYLLILITILYYFYHNHKKTKFEFIYKKNQKNKKILSSLSNFLKTYNPTFYLPHAVTQIVVSLKKLKKHHYTIKFKKQEIPIPNRGVMNLDWYPINYKELKNQPIVVFTLGAFGDVNVPYVKDMARICKNKNYRFLTINRRGYDFRKLKSEHFLDKKEYEDFRFVFKYLKKEFSCNIYFCGHSGGASGAVGLLGRFEDLGVKALFSISNPYNLPRVISNMKNSFFGRFCSKMMSKKFASMLKAQKDSFHFKKLLKKKKICEKEFLEIIENPKHLMNIDNQISKRISGDEHIYDFYNFYSCDEYIKDIKIPSLFLHSKEDLIVHKEFIPIDILYKNDNIITILTERGGHGEFFSDYDRKRWGFLLALEFFDIFEKKNKV